MYCNLNVTLVKKSKNSETYRPRGCRRRYGSYEAEALDAWDAPDGAYASGDARSWEADLGDARSCALCGGKKDFESVPSFSQCQASQQLAEALHVLAFCLKVFDAKH